jgi:hypothetical protein
MRRTIALILLPTSLFACGVVPVPFPGLERWAWIPYVFSVDSEGDSLVWSGLDWPGTSPFSNPKTTPLVYKTREECLRATEAIEREASFDTCTFDRAGCINQITGRYPYVTEPRDFSNLHVCRLSL